MAELFSTPVTKKETPNAPQAIDFKSAKGSQVKIIYKPIVVGGIAKSPVLITNLKAFIDDFEKETLAKKVEPVKQEAEVEDEPKL